MIRALFASWMVLSAAGAARADILYAVVNTSIVAIDSDSAALLGVVAPGAGFSSDGAYDPVSRRLYFLAGGTLPPSLVTLDAASGTVSQVALSGAAGGLAVNAATHELWGTDPAGDLVVVDPVTGQVQIREPAAGASGTVTFDPGARRLYALSTTPQTLTIVDLQTGVVTHRSLSGSVFGLAFDPTHGVLFGINNSQLLTIDPAGGTLTAVFTTPVANVIGSARPLVSASGRVSVWVKAITSPPLNAPTLVTFFPGGGSTTIIPFTQAIPLAFGDLAQSTPLFSPVVAAAAILALVALAIFRLR